MTTLDDLFVKRTSTRSFAPRAVAAADIVAMCEAARLAPSACNSQTWRFVAVSDRAQITRLCSEAMRPVIPNRWLAGAPLVIAGCSQLDLVANRIGAQISGIDYYRIDLGIAMEHMVLKATELGLGTCWIGWFSEDRVRRILSIPGRIRVSALLAVGYPADQKPKVRKRKKVADILFAEKWGRPFPTP